MSEFDRLPSTNGPGFGQSPYAQASVQQVGQFQSPPSGPRNFEDEVAKMLDGSSNHRPIWGNDIVRFELDGVPSGTLGRVDAEQNMMGFSQGEFDMEVELNHGASTNGVDWIEGEHPFDISSIDESKVPYTFRYGITVQGYGEPKCGKIYMIKAPYNRLRLRDAPTTRKAALELIRSELKDEQGNALMAGASVWVGDQEGMAAWKQRQQKVSDELKEVEELIAAEPKEEGTEEEATKRTVTE